MTRGIVLAVCLGPGGIPKRAVESAIVGELGLDGDAHRFRGHGGKNRAVCLFAIEDYATLRRDGVGCDAPGTFGENVLTEGLDYGELIRAGDMNAFAIGLGQDAPPGQTWAYNNSAIQTLSAVLEEATGGSPADFAETTLFEPIGMDDSVMTTDGAGNTITFMGLQTTCLDLARFGLLMLQGGSWDGEQVVSGDYVAQATATSSTELNAAYGYLFWLNHRGRIGSPALATTGEDSAAIDDGQLVPGVPEDVFWALGFHEQVVAVIPSEGIVAVRMGAEPPPDAPFGRNELTTGVLAALVDGSAPGS